MQSLDRHNASKMHETRSSLGLKRYTCECGKYYIHQQSLRNHKLKQHHKKANKCQPIVEIPPPSPIPLSSPQQITIEKIQQEIDDIKEEMQMIKKENADRKIVVSAPKTRGDNRIKINKEMRKEVVKKQENRCGECKEELSLYFQIDHIIAIQFGGTNDETNLMALCCECHAIKSIAENQCRQQIQDAIKNILREKQEYSVLS